VTTLVIDTSAAIAVLLGETAADDLVAQIAVASACFISAATLVELWIVMEARVGPAAAGIVDRSSAMAGSMSYPSTGGRWTAPWRVGAGSARADIRRA